MCVADLHYEDPLTSEPLRGPERLAAHAQRLWAGVPDARLNRTGPRLTDGTHVAAPARLLGTHLGTLGRFGPTGRTLEVHVVVYAELRDGRLWRIRAFFDLYAVAVELRVLPRAGTPGERALLLLRGFGLRQ